MTTRASRYRTTKTAAPETLESVHLATLAVDHSHSFDLYLRVGQRTALYRAKRTPFTKEDRDRLAAAGVKFVYIDASQRGKYRDYLLEQFTTLTAGHADEVDVCCECAQRCGSTIAQQLLATPDADDVQGAADRFVRATVDLLLHQPEAASGLVKVLQHDYHTYTHLFNVSVLSVILAIHADIREPQQLAHIGLGGILHDIGKARIDPTLLNSVGRLTDKRAAELRRHPGYGYEMLMDRRDLSTEVRQIIHQHHECLDGSGYPVGLVADEITAGAKICAIVDAYDAMTCCKPYRQALSVEFALEQLRRQSPAQLDGDLVQIWMDAVPNLREGQMQIRPGAAWQRPGTHRWPRGSGPDSMTSEDEPDRGSRMQDRGQLRAPSRSTQLIQERATPRRNLDVTVRIEFLRTCREPNTQQEALTVRTRDISTRGIGFYYPEVMYRGERVRLTLEADGQVVRAVAARIIWCRRIEQGRFLVGAAFETDPPD